MTGKRQWAPPCTARPLTSGSYGPQRANRASRDTVPGPMPRTSTRSASSVQGPTVSRWPTIACARLGPMPGMSSSSASVARLTSRRLPSASSLEGRRGPASRPRSRSALHGRTPSAGAATRGVPALRAARRTAAARPARSSRSTHVSNGAGRAGSATVAQVTSTGGGGAGGPPPRARQAPGMAATNRSVARARSRSGGTRNHRAHDHASFHRAAIFVDARRSRAARPRAAPRSRSPRAPRLAPGRWEPERVGARPPLRAASVRGGR